MGAASAAVCASSLIRYYGTFVVSIRRPVKDILTSDNRGINEMFAGDVSAVCPVSGPSCFSWRFSQLLLWFLLLPQRPYFVVCLGGCVAPWNRITDGLSA